MSKVLYRKLNLFDIIEAGDVCATFDLTDLKMQDGDWRELHPPEYYTPQIHFVTGSEIGIVVTPGYMGPVCYLYRPIATMGQNTFRPVNTIARSPR